jgi:alpha-beta hydrolase superfamily lysophospholipase
MPAPSLSRRDPPTRDDATAGVVLMLHGGKADGLGEVDETSASWRRSRWMSGHIAGRLERADVDVWLLRYAQRGWNAQVATPPSPVPDARWALDEVRRELGDVPVVLLGHSMGGRTAVAVADDPSVVGVVALAPWLPYGEPVAALGGKQLSVAHGRSDKITSFRQSRAFCRAAEGVASSVEHHDMGRVGHYMLRAVPAWNAFAVSRSLAQLGISCQV